MLPCSNRSPGVAPWCLLLLATTVALPARELVLRSAAGYLPSIPILVRVEVRGADGRPDRGLWDAEAALSVAEPGGSVAPDRVKLWNGLGTALVQLTPPPGGGPVTLTLQASAEGLSANRTLQSLAALPVSTVSGTTAAAAEWSGVVHVTGPVTVPAGGTLRILPGTHVLVDGVRTAEGQPGACRNPTDTPDSCGVSIVVVGALESLGTEAEPVVITASDPMRAWGLIDHDDGEPSLYQHTHVTRAGNSPRGGHTNTGAAIRFDETRVVFESCVVADTAGKSMTAQGADLELRDCVLARSVMGPEVDGTAVQLVDSYLLEFYGSDDNDGIYLHTQQAGQVIQLENTVIAGGHDDGIDTLASDVTIDGCIVRDFLSDSDPDTKGISLFRGESVIRKTIVASNKVGISVKGQNGDGAAVLVDRCTIVANSIGLQAEDKFGEPDLEIVFLVTSSIVRGAPLPGSIVTAYPVEDMIVSHSNLGESWEGAGNTVEDPGFVDAAAHDFRLAAGSPCIDAGDPAAAPDPDSSRADMGALPFTHTAAQLFVRGHVNADASLDLADAVSVLLYLFAGKVLACADAADADDDGTVAIADALHLLRHLFQDGPPPAAPAPGCGADSTVDELPCGGSVCP